MADRASSATGNPEVEPNRTEIKDPSRIIVTAKYDWSKLGRGKHIELSRGETLPLQFGEHLGRGSTSDVHEATCNGLRIAVKRRYLSRQAVDIASFKKEMQILERASEHHHIVKIIGSFVQARTVGILLWPVAGCDLGVFLDDLDTLQPQTTRSYYYPGHRKYKRSFISLHSDDLFLRFCDIHAITPDSDGIFEYNIDPAFDLLSSSFGCIASALAFLHGQGIKHKDLKPSNILLTTRERGTLYLTDFGSSTDSSQVTSSMTESGIRGTPRYFAPEVANYEPSGRSADIFSLGCIYVEMLYVYSLLPLKHLYARQTLRDHSFHANLESVIGGLTDVLLRYPLLSNREQLFSDLVLQMLKVDHHDRPSALEILDTLRSDIAAKDDDVFGRLIGSCCKRMEILA
ncbi:kinase-like domain-containing protein [Lophiotrema nucula]|uniref:Kinase-like domain-containing protein n=1 Tax=Lophiotrema nucula TaxID=690887 RepID=A0A6A5Z2F5_9PLEO|nr:kinase-like domain-containing protein [Lophiotrema nucula]